MDWDYHKYMASDTWAAKRVAAFKALGRNCKVCGTAKNIQVHHKTYKRLGRENVAKDLVILCQKHHSALHNFHQKGEFSLEEATVYYVAQGKKATQQRNKRARAKQKMTTPQRKKMKKKKTVSSRRKQKQRRQHGRGNLQSLKINNPFLHGILTDNQE